MVPVAEVGVAIASSTSLQPRGEVRGVGGSARDVRGVRGGTRRSRKEEDGADVEVKGSQHISNKYQHIS
jgi:hypothetical protein